MDLKPYRPQPIEDGSRLTKRQQLAQVRRAAELVKEARRFWPPSNWDALAADLERQADALDADIKHTDEAIYGKDYLRPHFVNCKNGLTTHSIVFRPNAEVDMPYLKEHSWNAIKRILGSPDGDGIEVDAPYDVYVCRGILPLHIIPRYE